MSDEDIGESESLSSMLTLDEARGLKPKAEAPKAESKAEVKAEPKAEPKVETKTEVKAEPEPKADERDDQGRFKAKEKPVKADVAAIMDERRKRQAAEERLKQFETQKPKTDIFENADKAIEERVQEQLAPLNERLFKLSIKAARAGREDYDDVIAAFASAADKDERLMQSFRTSDDPGEYAYSVGLQIRELADVDGDIVKYRDKVAGEYKGKLSDAEKMIAVLKAENAALKGQKAELDEVPQSLNSVSSGPSPKEEDIDDEPIAKLTRFNNQRR